MRIINKRALVFATISLVVGVILGVYNLIFAIVIAAILLIFSICGALFFIKRVVYKLANIMPKSTMSHFIMYRFVYILLFAAFVSGGLLGYFSIHNDNASLLPPTDGYIEARIDTANFSRNNERTMIIIASDTIFYGVNNKISLSRRVRLILTEFESNVSVGDRFRISGTLYSKSLMNSGEVDGYAYAENIGYEMMVIGGRPTILHSDVGFFEQLRLNLKNLLGENMSSGSAALSYAVLTGDTSMIDSANLEAFRAVGIAHIFAVSGLHVGLIVGVLNFLLRKCRCNLYIRLCLICAVLIFYNFFCGFSPSILRSSIMFVVIMAAKCLSQPQDRLTALAFSAVVNIAISPLIIFYVGFVLSYCAMLGIIMLSPVFSRALKRLPRVVGDTISSSLGAQLAILPACINFFGGVSLLGFITNIVFIPLFGVIFFLLIASTLVALVPIFSPALIVCSVIFDVLQYVTMWIGSSFGFSFTIYSIGWVAIIFFIIYFLLSDLFLARSKAKIVSVVAAVLCLMCGVAVVEGTEDIPADSITVFNYSSAALVSMNGKKILLLTEENDYYEPIINYVKKARIRDIDMIVPMYLSEKLPKTYLQLCGDIKLGGLAVPLDLSAQYTELYTSLDNVLRQQGGDLVLLSTGSENDIAQFICDTKITEDLGGNIKRKTVITSAYFDCGILVTSNVDSKSFNTVVTEYGGIGIKYILAERYADLFYNEFKPIAVLSSRAKAYERAKGTLSADMYGIITRSCFNI